MGKDVRGIERGKCACGECEDFMRSDGTTCGYCGCLPTRHSKKDAHYSSHSVGGTSAAGTSESEKWKGEGSRTQRANILNSQIVLCQNSTCPFGPLVPTRNAFATLGYFSKLEQFESLHCEKGELYMEYRQMLCQERNGQLCEFCEKDETTSAPLPT